MKISPTAEYVTSGGNEIRIKKTDSNLWFCYFYRGGPTPECLRGMYLSKGDLHKAIVRYLQSDNVLGKARWPK